MVQQHVFRPETVLRRSAELLSVNQPMAALSSISEVFSSKRFRTTPLASLEPIMLKFLELCVDLKKGRTAKEGLHMYKNVAQNTSVISVETVINSFLTRSKDKLAEALQKVDEIEGPEKASGDKGEAEVEDLEASETPESILLSSVSDEKSRDRTYRTVVTPWLRFLWEAYRTSLDILRNNPRLENLYQQIAHEAFTFCLTHKRQTEFRRLCEILRQHLASSQKYSHQPHSINLSDPETLQRHLDTRFHQLNTAVELELWQEAFRTAEDIHGLVSMSKRMPKASMMISYYEKLVKVFAVGNNFLFHAAAYGKYHSTQIAAGKDEADAGKAASLVLLSALAVPVAGEGMARRRDGSAIEESESARSKAVRLAALLGLTSTPTRADLLRDALKHDVLRKVSPQLRSLYNILEVDFHPLSITKKIDPILTDLAKDPDTARYVKPLEEVVLARLFSQLGQVYDSIALERAIRLSTFGSESQDPLKARARIERFIAGACRRGDLDVTFDHSGASISFDQDVFGSSISINDNSELEKTLLQPAPSLLLRTQLSRLAQCLYKAVDAIDPKSSPQGEAVQNKEAALQAMLTSMAAERKTLLARKQIIERRKEQADESAARKEKEEAQLRAQRIAARAEEHARKEREDARQRELDRIKKENERIKRQEAAAMAESIAKKSGIDLKIKDIDTVDTSTLVRISVEAIEKEKKDLAEKIRVVGKRMDHLERANRKEEQPMLVQDYHRQQTRDRAAFDRGHEQRVAEMKERHANDLATKARLASVLPDYHAFRAEKEKQARADNAKAEEESKAKIAAEKKARRNQIMQEREQRRQQREEEFEAQRRAEEEEERLRQEREQEEADRIAREEEERAASEAKREAEAAEAAAKAAARKAERDAEFAKLDEQARKQREREEEIERKAAEKRNAPAPVGSASWKRAKDQEAATAAPSLGRTAVPPPASGGWRARQQAAQAAAQASGASPQPASPVASPAPTPAQAPAQAPAPSGPPRVVPAGGGWREKQAAKAAAAAANGTAPATNGTPTEEKKDDGFQPVKQGAYRPPGARPAGGAGGRW